MTKAEKVLACRRLLQTRVGRLEHDEALFLLTHVFPLHHDWESKRGCGVNHIEVRKHGPFGANGFFIVRTDDSFIDISYRVALNGRTEYAVFTAAARGEIHLQISRWRAENPGEKGLHVDHIESFDAILKDWLASIQLNYEEINISKQRVGHMDMFLSRDLALSWQRFHRNRARYQWLEASVNIAKSNTSAPTEAWIAEYNEADA